MENNEKDFGSVKIANVREPKRLKADSDENFVCLVDLDFGNGWEIGTSYVCHVADIAPTGKWVYEQVISGNAGTIEDYVEPQPRELTYEEKADIIRSNRDYLLKQLDVVISNPLRWNDLTPEKQNILAEYRKALLDIPQQSGFPDEASFPDVPSLLV